MEWTEADGRLAAKGVRAWASELLQTAAVRRLQAASDCTQLPAADDWVLPALTPSMERLAEEVRGARAQLGDTKRFWGQASRVRAAAHGCPYGCGCAFRWHDVVFRCSGAPMKTARAELADAVQEAYEGIAMQLTSTSA